MEVCRQGVIAHKYCFWCFVLLHEGSARPAWSLSAYPLILWRLEWRSVLFVGLVPVVLVVRVRLPRRLPTVGLVAAVFPATLDDKHASKEAAGLVEKVSVIVIFEGDDEGFSWNSNVAATCGCNCTETVLVRHNVRFGLLHENPFGVHAVLIQLFKLGLRIVAGLEEDNAILIGGELVLDNSIDVIHVGVVRVVTAVALQPHHQTVLIVESLLNPAIVPGESKFLRDDDNIFGRAKFEATAATLALAAQFADAITGAEAVVEVLVGN
mmetsp:Transcript_6329/g.13231  ORF Transcript_6329/g.13231 Transcript_6329/m.13231 type:complete len:267 (+) Transcript_6329:119-919(+)